MDGYQDAATTKATKRRRSSSAVQLSTEKVESELSNKKAKVLVEDSGGLDAATSQSKTTSLSTKDEEPSLELLLDLSAIDNQIQLQERFDQIAKALLCDYNLAVNRLESSARLEIMELEFYVQKAGFHEDPFTHGSEEQKIAGRWYFHRAPRRSEDSNRSLTSTTMWREGSRKGLDLTIGRPPTAAHSPTLLRGGILLRSIRVLGRNSRVVSGPSLLVDEILSQSGVKEIKDLVNDKWKGDTAAFTPHGDLAPSDAETGYSLRLVPKTKTQDVSKSSIFSHVGKSQHSTSSTTIYSSPRIGLDLSHPGTTGPKVRPFHSRIRFLPRAYRYFREPHLLVANGRPQTFAGVLLHCTKNAIIAKRPSNKSATTNVSSESATIATSSSASDSDKEFAKALTNPRLVLDICRITGLKEATAQKYFGYYIEGRKAGEDVLVVGPEGKGASNSPSTYLKMMGAMSTLILDA